MVPASFRGLTTSFIGSVFVLFASAPWRASSTAASLRVSFQIEDAPQSNIHSGHRFQQIGKRPDCDSIYSSGDKRTTGVLVETVGERGLERLIY